MIMMFFRVFFLICLFRIYRREFDDKNKQFNVLWHTIIARFICNIHLNKYGKLIISNLKLFWQILVCFHANTNITMKRVDISCMRLSIHVVQRPHKIFIILHYTKIKKYNLTRLTLNFIKLYQKISNKK